MVNVLISTALSVGIGLIKQAMIKDTITKTEGPRLGNTQITSADEGNAIVRVWGKFRVGGQLIWTTNFREEIIVDRTVRGGKGGPKQISESTTYKYYCSFAIGVCESVGGAKLGRVFIDGAQIDLSKFTYRFYDGSDTQNPDPKIVATEGEGNVPAYRGLCYIVFEEVELTDYGNRLPQVSVEVSASSSGDITSEVEGLIRSVELAPGVGEFAYATEAITQGAGSVDSTVININTTRSSTPDIQVALDQLEVDAPNVDSAALTVAWFADSLDATLSLLKPKVEAATLVTEPRVWRVSDRIRSNAEVVAGIGGTPSDLSVRQAVAEMKTRGMRVMFHPMVLIDFTVQDEQPLPIFNSGGEFVYSGWTSTVGALTSRTADPAPHSGMAYFHGGGSAMTVAHQDIAIPSNMASFIDLGSIDLRIEWYQASWHTSGNDQATVNVEFYDAISVKIGSTEGPALTGVTPEKTWTLKQFTVNMPPSTRTVRVIMSMQRIEGGNNDGYIDSISATLISTGDGGVGLSWRDRIEGDSTNYIGTVDPSDFGAWNGTRIPYSGPSGEWSHRRMVLHYARLLADQLVAGDAFLVGSEMAGLTATDPTWGDKLADLMTDVRTILAPGVLVSYAASWKEYKDVDLDPVWSSADFIGIDNYLPITDWSDGDEVYTVEAFKAGIDSGEWWDYYYASDADRAAGIQTPIVGAENRQKDIKYWATTNYPGTPVWFTEFGCPAIDKGANQPDIFFDFRTGEIDVPYHSNGNRNDTVQRLYLQAMLEYWGDDGFVDPVNMFVRCWDVRPFPQFPALTDKWSDGENWIYGHWLNGRLGVTTLGQITESLMLMADYDYADFDVSRIQAAGIIVGGMGIFTISTVRAIIENLMKTYSFDVFETSGAYKFVMRGESDEVAISIDDLIMNGDASYTKSRRQDVDLPDRTTVKFLDVVRDYAAATVDGHTVTGFSVSVDDFVTNCVLPVDYAKSLADILTQEQWVAKNSITFSLPMTYLRVEVGDAFNFTVDGVTRRYRIGQKTIGEQIDIEASGYAEVIYQINQFNAGLPGAEVATPYGSSLVIFAELPVTDELYPNLWSPRVLVAQRPWPGGVLIFEDDNAGGYLFNSRQTIPSITGSTLTDLPKGVTELWDVSSTVNVRIDDAAYNLTSTTDAAVLNGANLMAVLTPSGEWEVFQFATAVLETDGTFTLSRLLRGKLGTEPYIGDPTPAGSRIVVYDASRFGVISGTEDRLNVPFESRYGPAGIDVTDNRYIDEVVTPRGVAYRPYSPVQLRQRLIGNDIELSWVRRTRFGGDPWVDGEVPLNEETETYEIDIIGGSTLTVVGTTSVLYTLAEQITDFGGAQTSVGWTIYQMSDKFGRGAPANG